VLLTTPTLVPPELFGGSLRRVGHWFLPLDMKLAIAMGTHPRLGQADENTEQLEERQF
jgi:hypothetical protein